jgi:two-component sensor histidine kinase
MAPPSRRCLGWAVFTSIEIGDAPPGGPPVEPPTRRGFGTRVMEGMVRGQLNGEMRFDWCTEGLACEFVFPA